MKNLTGPLFKRRILAGFFCLLMTIAASTQLACKNDTSTDNTIKPKKITITVTPSPASSPIYIAYDKGFFKEAGLDASLDQRASGQLAIRALTNNEVDIALSASTPIAEAAVEGHPISVIATLSENSKATRIIARKDRGITKTSDIKGKRIGLVKNTMADFFLHIFMATSFFEQDDVNIVYLEADKIVDALVEGKVDAVSTWSPYTLELIDKLGDNAVIFDKPGIYTTTWNISSTKRFIIENPETIKAFLSSIIKANEFIGANPDEARELAKKHLKIDSPLFIKDWPNYDFSTKLEQSLIVNLEDQIRWITDKQSAAKEQIDEATLIFSDALQELDPDAVKIVGNN